MERDNEQLVGSAPSQQTDRYIYIYMSSFIAGFAAAAGLIALARRRHGTALAAIVLLIVNLIWLLRT
jgi:hypothetical protein